MFNNLKHLKESSAELENTLNICCLSRKNRRWWSRKRSSESSWTVDNLNGPVRDGSRRHIYKRVWSLQPLLHARVKSGELSARSSAGSRASAKQRTRARCARVCLIRAAASARRKLKEKLKSAFLKIRCTQCYTHRKLNGFSIQH